MTYLSSKSSLLTKFVHEPAIVPYPITLAFAVLLGLHGYRSGSLNKSGAIAASSLGYLTLANPLKLFGVALLVFYFSGSRVTKVKAAYKLTLEDPHTPLLNSSAGSSTPPKVGGNRDAFQVACNALFGAACAVGWRALYAEEFEGVRAKPGWGSTAGTVWCVLEQRAGWSRALVLGAVAFWGACAGDTFASELGILSSSPPRLVTTLRSVPRGTNGGISPWGLFVSLVGGLLVGTAGAISLSLENGECSRLGTTTIRLGAAIGLNVPYYALVMGVGAWSGVVGSLIDSFLGATLQQSLYSVTRHIIVPSRSHAKDSEDEIINVPGSGYAILSNNLVNLVSSAGTGAIVVYWSHSR